MIDVVGDVLMLIGGAVAALAGIGLLKFDTPYARFHAAGKASPVAFLIAAVGAAIHLGWTVASLLLVAVMAMVLTLPVGVHLLFRAVHRTTESDHMVIDQLAEAHASRRTDGLSDESPPTD